MESTAASAPEMSNDTLAAKLWKTRMSEQLIETLEHAAAQYNKGNGIKFAYKLKDAPSALTYPQLYPEVTVTVDFASGHN